MATLKELAASAKLVAQEGLEKALVELKNYIDTKDAEGDSSASEAIAAVNERLDTLIGSEDGDADKVINTFNEIKRFLEQIDDDGNTLKQILDAVNTAISNEVSRASTAEQANAQAVADEKSRAETAENALSGRVTTLENVSVMTAAEAGEIFNQVFNA